VRHFGLSEERAQFKVIKTDQADNFAAFKKKRELMSQAIKKKRDPMQLEFDPLQLILRLNRMKNVLSRGNIVNQTKLHQGMCESLEASKKFSAELQQKHMQ